MPRRISTLFLAALAAGLTGALTTVATPAELVMVEEPGCPWCALWNREIGPIYPKTAEGRIAPLRRIDISERTPEDFSYGTRVVFTPTFVLVEDGRELDRIEGYPGEELFWWRLSKLLKDHGYMTEEQQ